MSDDKFYVLPTSAMAPTMPVGAQVPSSVTDLNSRRKPVIYEVCISHGYDGAITVHVAGVADDARSRESVAWALRQAADVFSPNRT